MMYTMNMQPRGRRPEFGFESMLRSFFDEPMRPMMRPMRVREEKDGFVAEAAFPGIPQEKIEIEVNDGTLRVTVDLSRGDEKEHESEHFERELNLEGIDEDNISATYRDGLLRIMLPKEKQPDARPARKISIANCEAEQVKLPE